MELMASQLANMNCTRAYAQMFISGHTAWDILRLFKKKEEENDMANKWKLRSMCRVWLENLKQKKRTKNNNLGDYGEAACREYFSN